MQNKTLKLIFRIYRRTFRQLQFCHSSKYLQKLSLYLFLEICNFKKGSLRARNSDELDWTKQKVYLAVRGIQNWHFLAFNFFFNLQLNRFAMSWIKCSLLKINLIPTVLSQPYHLDGNCTFLVELVGQSTSLEAQISCGAAELFSSCSNHSDIVIVYLWSRESVQGSFSWGEVVLISWYENFCKSGIPIGTRFNVIWPAEFRCSDCSFTPDSTFGKNFLSC